MFTLKCILNSEMKINRLNIDAVFGQMSGVSEGLWLVLTYSRLYLDLRRAGRQKVGFSTVVTDGWSSFKTDCCSDRISL